MNYLKKYKSKITHKFFQFWVMILLTIHTLFASNAHAQLDKIKLPSNIKVDGVDEDSGLLEIIIGVIKVIAQIALWAIIIIAAVSMLKNILKSINRASDNAREEGGIKWGAVIGDILGNVAVIIILLLIGVWLQSYF